MRINDRNVDAGASAGLATRRDAACSCRLTRVRARDHFLGAGVAKTVWREPRGSVGRAFLDSGRFCTTSATCATGARVREGEGHNCNWVLLYVYCRTGSTSDEA